MEQIELTPEIIEELNKRVAPYVEEQMIAEYNFKIFIEKHKEDLSEFLQGTYNYYYKAMTDTEQYTLNGLLQLAFIDGMLHMSNAFPEVMKRIVDSVANVKKK